MELLSIFKIRPELDGDCLGWVPLLFHLLTSPLNAVLEKMRIE